VRRRHRSAATQAPRARPAAAPGFDRLRIAGDPERETRAKREKDGINVDPTTWKEIHAAGAKLGLESGTIDRLAAG